MSITVSISNLAEHLQAQISDLGDGTISGVASLKSASSGSLCFYNHARFQCDLENTQASAVLISKNHAHLCPVTALIVDDPELAFLQAMRFLDKDKLSKAPSIHPTACLGEGCQIADDVSIGAYCVIGNGVRIGSGTILDAHVVCHDHVVVGKACRLGPHVVCYSNVEMGDRVFIHAHASLGADGFGYLRRDQQWLKIPQKGGVSIGNDVEIGAHTAIDCGRLDNTIIEDGVKLDNHIHIAHNVFIGAHTVIAACTGIAGSTRVGSHCVFGGHVGIGDNVSICDGVMLSSKSGVMKSITKPGTYGSGIPVEPMSFWFRIVVRLKQLDQIYQRLKKLEQSQ